MLDALYYSSSGEISTPLKRYIQIDIDDIFVGAEGTRIGKDDVDEMIKFQEKWKNIINDFHFVIGYSGKFIYRGNKTETEGDKYILEKKGNYRLSKYEVSKQHLGCVVIGNIF